MILGTFIFLIALAVILFIKYKNAEINDGVYSEMSNKDLKALHESREAKQFRDKY